MAENNFYPPIRRSRVEQHSKRRKSNFILNILIAIVFLLIIIVGGSILLDSDTKNNDLAKGNLNKNSELTSGAKNEDNEAEEKEETNTEEQTNDETNTEQETDESVNPSTNPSEEETTGTETEQGAEIVVNESENDPNVIKTVINPAWKPIGTVQQGEHITQYDEGTVDRKEMEKALAYAANISEDNMIVWWLQNGGQPNKNVIGTITTKDQKQVFRIFLDWVDGQGWKPTKLQYLKENDKK